MSYIKGVIQEEYDRLNALVDKYQAKIAEYPKGGISIKKRNHREYVYLAVRKADKVKFQYIGAVDSEKAGVVKDQINTRKQFEEKLKQVKADLKEIEKVLHGRKL
ncbi:MAG: hypothetical protein CSA22_01960 [Deltaproteobacteria bacterium]|nr:MAG: hypothetical protein CSA22_01960 [Deltaproteobacteria bacterium]